MIKSVLKILQLLHNSRENVAGMFSERRNNIARLNSNLKTVLGLSCVSLTHLRYSRQIGDCWAEPISLYKLLYWNALQSFQKLMP